MKIPYKVEFYKSSPFKLLYRVPLFQAHPWKDQIGLLKTSKIVSEWREYILLSPQVTCECE